MTGQPDNLLGRTPALDGMMSFAWRKARRGLGRYLPTRPFRLRNAEPLVSFTFDDVPQSALDYGATVLERHGMRGTFYIAPGICGSQDTHWRVIDEAGVAELHARGHEVGAHTFSHERISEMTRAELRDNDAKSQVELKRICGGGDIVSFAYPFGVVSIEHKLYLQSQYATCRGIYQGINAGLVDLSVVASCELYDTTIDRAGIERLLDETVARNGWLVFYTHDCCERPSHIGCSPRLLDFAAEAVARRRLKTVTMADASVAIGYRR